MDRIRSFKGYGKVDEAEERAFREKTRRRIIIIGVSCAVLAVVIVGVVAGTIVHNRGSGSKSSASSSPATELTPSAFLKKLCGVTRYPDSCFSSISSFETANTSNPKQLFKLSLQVAVQEIGRFADYVSAAAGKTNGADNKTKAALEVCGAVIDDAGSQLNDSVSLMEVGSGKSLLSAVKINDMKTWLSSTITNLDTCLDTVEEMNSTMLDDLKSRVQNSTEFTSNSLAIVTKFLSLLFRANIPIHRKLLSFGFPDWVSPADRRLLQATDALPNVTVAQDGSGDCLTITEAVEKVPDKSLSRFIIHVKEGRYVENVNIDKSKWNVMMYGDGKDKTIVSGSRNYGVDKVPTFLTATFAVVGKGFIVKNMAFMNTAGAVKQQAVAFRSGSDMSVMYRCLFDAFQDTLYAHSNRQFYRDCDITGTVDFVFGNAASVFQGCSIMPREPMAGQFNTITAQGKTDPNQNSGFSIQKCTISPNGDVTAQTYLGRPWKNYSTAVIMQSAIGDVLNPEGWTQWNSTTPPPRTLSYGEYLNTGPGASTTQRVTWTGYNPSLTTSEAVRFTVEPFIQGSSWLPEASVTFDSSL